MKDGATARASGCSRLRCPQQEEWEGTGQPPHCAPLSTFFLPWHSCHVNHNLTYAYSSTSGTL